MPFIFLFIVLPILELVLLIKVGSSIGVLAILAWIALTGIAGILIMRTQGFVTMMNVRQRMLEGALPAREVANGFFITLAGFLLFLPGLITDAFGLLLLLPPVRFAMMSAALKAFKARSSIQFTTFTQTPTERPVYDAQDNRLKKSDSSSTIIDGEYRRED